MDAIPADAVELRDDECAVSVMMIFTEEAFRERPDILKEELWRTFEAQASKRFPK
jgi:hypothetical protein